MPLNTSPSAIDVEEHDNTYGVRKVSPFSSDANGNLIRQEALASPKALIIDESVAGTTYIGSAAIGTATSAATWRIYRITVLSGITTFSWPGNSTFTNIWDNRASLSYS